MLHIKTTIQKIIRPLIYKCKAGKKIVQGSKFMATTKEAISKLEAHERECAIRYENIEKRLEDGSKRFDKLENMIWAVYPFILLSVVLSRFV